MRLTTLLTLLFIPFLLFSQKKVAQELIGLEISGAEFEKIDVFKFNTSDIDKRADDLEGLEEGTILNIDKNAIKKVRQRAPALMQMAIPFGEKKDIILDLVEYEIFTPDFQLKTSDAGKAIPYEKGLHYKGIVRGDQNSLVAISIFEDEIMGLISTDEGNLVLGKLQQSNNNEHIIYFDKNLPAPYDFSCGTPDDEAPYTKADLAPATLNRDAGDCIRVYIEIDNDIVNQKGGASNATNYITGLFGQTIILYANENIEMVISEIFAWTSSSPYSSTSSSGMLSDYQNNTGSFNGDLSHLVSYQASGGIAAGFSGICNSNPDNSKCFSSIDASYSNVPSYSFSVMVVTHEMGHLIGSRHTHACVWNGNNTAIDGCAGQTEGSCSLPGYPSEGGTIMSYCHIQSVGINFNLGFGSQPGNVVRNTVNASGNCLTSCGGTQATCSDGIQNQGETGVDCGGPCAPCPCVGTNVTVTIVLDNYPEETSWSIVNASNQTVASGGTYGSQPDGSTVTATTCLADGCYDFIINDAYGDGICCGYGNGSYSVSDGSSTVASGGSFGSSETTNFCIGGGGGPTCTDGIQNQGEEGVDCGGPCAPCATCNDGIQNQGEEGVDCGGPCAPCATCNDGIQNQGEEGVDCGGPCAPCGGGGNDVLFGHYFESGLDGWVDGGSDCFRSNTSYSWEGNYSIRLRDNSGTASSMTLNNVNVSGYNSLELEFYFYPNSMENGEDFWLRVRDNSSGWTTVAAYAAGTSFNNGSFYVATVTISSGQFNFNNPLDFRFQCDASSNGDRVYMDEITLTGIGGSALVEAGSTIKEVERTVNPTIESLSFAPANEDGVEVYPNPVNDILTLDYLGDIQSIKVVSMQGKVMKKAVIEGDLRHINMAGLPSGMYFIMIEKDGEMIPKKVMKM